MTDCEHKEQTIKWVCNKCGKIIGIVKQDETC